MLFRKCCVVLVSLLPVSMSGCALWHELQPHRLHRLNRVPAPHLDPEFSQVDPAKPSEWIVVRAQNERPGVADAGL